MAACQASTVQIQPAAVTAPPLENHAVQLAVSLEHRLQLTLAELHRLHLLHLAHERRLSILRAEAAQQSSQQAPESTRNTAIPPVIPPAGKMPQTYTYAQLEQLWISAGGSSALAPLMAAIAMAESAGNPTAYNPSGATGLWQILGAVNPSDQANLTNPQVNAHEAVLKYQTQGLQAWEAYTNGSYRQFFNGNIPAQASVGSNAASGSQVNLMSDTTGANPSDALNQMGEIFHGAASMLNWGFWLFEPGQGWRFVLGVGGVASGIAAAKLYTSPSVTQEKSAAFPAAILFTGVSLLCLYMTLRAWPVTSDNKAIRPAEYAVMILKGQKPPAGPGPTDNIDAIQGGLEVIASIWIVNKAANSISNLAGAAGILGSIWAGIKGVFGKAASAGDIPEVASLTVPAVPGLGPGPSGTGVQLV
jgi:hypothetical protein